MRRKVPLAEEAGRHAVFHQPDIFEAEPDSGFDHLTALAADIFAAPLRRRASISETLAASFFNRPAWTASKSLLATVSRMQNVPICVPS